MGVFWRRDIVRVHVARNGFALGEDVEVVGGGVAEGEGGVGGEGGGERCSGGDKNGGKKFYALFHPG